MGVLEKLSQALHNNEEKTVELRQRFSNLISEWGCFEKDLQLSTKCLQECFNEMESKRMNLGSVQQSVVDSLKELDSIRESIERKRVEVERKEEILESKWKDFNVAQQGFAEIVKLREEKLNDQEKMVERLWEEVEFERKQFGDVDGKFKQISLKEKELNKIQSWIQQETDALELKDRELAEKLEEFQVKEHSLLSIKKELEVKEMGLESAKKELAVKECELHNLKNELKVNESNLDNVKKELSRLDNVKKELRVNENKLDNVKKDLAVKECKLDNVKKEVRLKESKLEFLRKELREKENNLESLKMEVGVKENRLDSVKKELRVKESDLDFLKKELGVKENRLDYVKKELREKETNLDSVKKEVREKEKNLDYVKIELREKETNLDSVKKELREKEKNLDYVKKEIMEKETNLDSAKKELAVKVTSLDSTNEELRLMESNLDKVMRVLEEEEKNLDFVINELRDKENDLESMKKEFQVEADNLNTLRKQLESKEDFLSSMKKELEHKEKFLDTMKKKLEIQEEHLKSSLQRLHLREREISSTHEAYKQRFEELNSKEKKLDSLEDAMRIEQGLVEQRMKDVILREERVKDKLEDLESREKYFEDRSKELGEKEKQLNAIANAHIKVEPTEDAALDRVNAIAGISAVIRSVVIMDGKSLQIFLNEHEKELDLMSDDVLKALQMSSDPAQLVLDAMEGFYPPHLTKGETEFEDSVAQRSCILLLEQLIRVSPKIRPLVKAGAMKLAREWKGKMKATEESQYEILGFLYLLASYSLVSAFDEAELMILLEIVAKHDKFAGLCRSLGLKQKIPCFIQNLLTKQQHLEAIRCAYAFELVDDFPPMTILRDYLTCVERSYVDVCEKATCSIKEKIEAIEQRVTSIRAVIRCILDYKLQSQYPVEQLEDCIEVLTRLREDQTALFVICEAKKPEQFSVKQMDSSNTSISRGTKALNSGSFSARALTCTLSHSNAMAVILMNMSGKNLQNFLNTHLKEHKLLRGEALSALRMSPDPGMLVLEALEGFYPPDYQKEEIGFDRNIIRQSCIVLLEQLMKLSPEIKPAAKLEASKLAFAWKAKMLAEMENHLAILGFLLLLGSYQLASVFDKDELGSLYHKVAHHGSTSELCCVLGISDDTSRSDDFPPLEESKRHKVQVSTNESICKSMDTKCKGRDAICICASSLHHTSDPGSLVLDALRSCDHTNLGRSENVLSVLRSFSDLLDQLREVSPEIEPLVQAGAAAYAVDWYSRLIGSQLNPPEVLAFLQFVATYKLTASFDSSVLLGLLDKVHHIKRVVTLFKILGLTDKIQCFVQNLINKKLWLVAFTYVYEFELVNFFSPVLLLKEYVRHSKQIAQQILHAENSSHRAQIKAISFEINALRKTVRHVVDRGLQVEFSPSYLQEEIVMLQFQMSILAQSSQNQYCTGQQVKTNKGTSRSAPITQVRKKLTRKRRAPAGDHKAQEKHNFKRSCHFSMRR